MPPAAAFIAPRRHCARRASALATVATLLVALLLPAATAGAQEAKPSKISFPSEVRYHGVLAGIPKAVETANARVAAVDDKRRRLYAMYRDGLGTATKYVLNSYDLAPGGNPPLLQSRVIKGATLTATGTGFGGDFEPYSTAYDERRQHVLFSKSGNTGVSIDRLDVRRSRALPPFNVTAEAPGFSPLGITYARGEDRIYLLGEITGTALVGTMAGIPGLYRGVTAVVALDAESGKFAWVRPVSECQQPLVTYTVGSLIARSSLREALYFFCHAGGGDDLVGEFVGMRYPGQSALVRLNIDPTAAQADVRDFGVDVFPVSGQYKNGQKTGISAFDPRTDRVIVQSRTPRTPGAWVFDGRIDAWVGFITAPDSNNAFLAVNPRTGRHYMGGQTTAGAPPHNAYLNIVDARLSPVPQGLTIPLHDGTGLGDGGIARIALDSKTQRLFPNRVGTDRQIAVLEDTTPLQSAEPPLDFDSLTSDAPIRPDTLVQYSGGAAGFGANLRLVGGVGAGYGGIPGFIGEDLRTRGIGGVPPCASVGVDEVSCVSAADRELTLGSVPSVDMRSSGTSARATALATDATTDAERDGARRNVRDRTDGKDDGPARALNPVFGSVDCLDGGGDRQHKSSPAHPLGSAEVTCDLAKDSVTAKSIFGDLTSAPLGISSSAYDTRAVRTKKGGATTTTIAVAKGVRIGAPAGAHVSIGRVTAIARTKAGGRPGTTEAVWERTLSGVTIADATGKDVVSLPGCSTVVRAIGGKKTSVTESGDCGNVIASANDALKGRAYLRLPLPEIEATPRGAFAAVSKTQRDFLQASTLQNDDRRAVPGLEAILLNDGEEKSRLVVQLAGVEANSIFLISNFAGPHPWTNTGGKTPLANTSGESSNTDADPSSSGGGNAPANAPVSDAGASGSGGTAAGDPAPPVEDSVAAPATADAPVAAADLASGPIASRVAAGLRWLARTPGEAALIGGMWLLFAGAFYTALRRGLLLRSLNS